MKYYDAVVIGSGPAGMTAALYLSRFGLSVAIAEMLSPGGQMLKTHDISNYPGFPKGAMGWELADNFAAHMDTQLVDKYADTVIKMERDTSAHIINIDKNNLHAKTVVIASGASQKKLGLDREADLTGRGVSYCAMCDGQFFKDQIVGMVGGGNAALEEALYLTKLVKKLYLIHRRDAFRADKFYQDKLAGHAGKIEYVLDSVVCELHGEKDLDGIGVRNVKTGAMRNLALSGLFVFIGLEPQSGFFPPGLELDPFGFIVTDAEMRTSIPGIFAAGDIRSKMCRQVITAAGDGATAAHAAFAYLEHMDA
jgi:thioredoxin reductase (NADPH)